MTPRILIVLALGCTHALQTAPVRQPEGAIQGVVKDVKGNKLRGARITVTSSALAQPRVDRTDGNGYYRIEHLPPGDDYQVTIAYEGAGETHAGVHVTDGMTTPVFQALQLGHYVNGVPWCDAVPADSRGGVCFP